MSLSTLQGICQAIGKDNVVSIATGYGLYIVGIEFH
jgi:hypothetical protein